MLNDICIRVDKKQLARYFREGRGNKFKTLSPMEFTLRVHSFGGETGSGRNTRTWLLREARTYLIEAEIKDLTHSRRSCSTYISSCSHLSTV